MDMSNISQQQLNPDTSKHLYLIDNLKGLLIFLVVFGHSLESYKTEHVLLNSIYIFIYLFHMPAFVFISGYLSKDLDKARDTAFKNFLIPFIIFNTLWNTIIAITTRDFSAFSFITPGWTLWYLLSMFFWKIFLKDLVRIKYVFSLSILIGIGVGILNEFGTTLSLSRTFVFLPFFLLGYFTKRETLFTLKKPTRLFSMGIILLTIGCSVLISYLKFIPVEFLYGSESFLSATIPIWIGILSRCAIYILGFSFIFVLVNIVSDKPSFFSQLGKNTFPIYILHTYLLMIVFGIHYVVPSIWGRIFISLLGTISITFLLSRPKVTYYFNLFLKKIYTVLLKNISY